MSRLSPGMMTQLGYSQADVAEIFGISERTVRRDLTTYRRQQTLSRSN